MRDYPGKLPEPSVILPHKEEARVQSLRDAIRELAAELSAPEGAAHMALLDSTEDAILRKRKADIEASSFDFDRVPNEIRNMIHGYSMVQERPVQPFVAHTSNEERRAPRKFDLGGNLLTTSKAVYQQGLPILLGANTFEVNRHFDAFLGSSNKSRVERAKLVKKVIVPELPTEPEGRSIRKLLDLEECTIVGDAVTSRSRWRQGGLLTLVDPKLGRDELERRAIEAFERLSPAVRNLLCRSPNACCYYLHEFRMDEVASGCFKVAAIRLRVFLNCTDLTCSYGLGYPIKY